MTPLMDFGDNLAELGPEGQQGLMMLLGGHASALQARRNAMDLQMRMQRQALDAHTAGQQALERGDIAAHQAIFGGGPGSASSALTGMHGKMAPILDARGADTKRLGDAAMEAWMQEQTARNRTTRAPGAGGAFEQAMANADAGTGARNQRLDLERRGNELAGDAIRRLGNVGRDGRWNMALAQMDAGKERDLSRLGARGHGTVSRLRNWQAGQVRPRFDPKGMMARAFGPLMMRRGAADERAKREELLGGEL